MNRLGLVFNIIISRTDSRPCPSEQKWKTLKGSRNLVLDGILWHRHRPHELVAFLQEISFKTEWVWITHHIMTIALLLHIHSPLTFNTNYKFYKSALNIKKTKFLFNWKAETNLLPLGWLPRCPWQLKLGHAEARSLALWVSHVGGTQVVKASLVASQGHTHISRKLELEAKSGLKPGTSLWVMAFPTGVLTTMPHAHLWKCIFFFFIIGFRVRWGCLSIWN